MLTKLIPILLSFFFVAVSFGQMPPVEPGVSHELAKWRAARYSDVRYKLNLTLEKMSPVLKGTIEIRVRVEGEKRSGLEKETGANGSVPPAVAGGALNATANTTPIILDWRKIPGSEQMSIVYDVSINDVTLKAPPATAGGTDPTATYEERNEHLIFRDGVVAGENVIKLDFTSPILTSGSAITRYVDREDGAEYIYSLFVPSDASTAFPVFDQPDLKARFNLTIASPTRWGVVSNERSSCENGNETVPTVSVPEYIRTQIAEFKRLKKPSDSELKKYAECTSHFPENGWAYASFPETKPISTYVFAFAAGPWKQVSVPGAVATGVLTSATKAPVATAPGTDKTAAGVTSHFYVRKSQAAKFKPHAAEVFRLTREGIKYLETYFDYKFPFPKYDIVLIPEFPFGGMEHAGATFLREDRVIFPQEPTKNDFITRANLIFHEAAHQWFGDTVTMKWFDDLWLKEGFAEFMAYKTLEKVMPEYNAWKVFYERNKQAAYLTDSTKGTTPIYQEIANLNAAKSAYGNIVYRKAPSFLRQAEFYLGPDKFQTAVRAFLKKHEFKNAEWADLVEQFANTNSKRSNGIAVWTRDWVENGGVPIIWTDTLLNNDDKEIGIRFFQKINFRGDWWEFDTNLLLRYSDGTQKIRREEFIVNVNEYKYSELGDRRKPVFVFPNYQDYGYGIFLLDDKSRDYVLKNIQNEKDDFLRTMMWGSLWDSVREGELDPKEYVELVVKNLGSDVRSSNFSWPNAAKKPAKAGTPNTETDESTIQTLLGRVSTAMRYYLPERAGRNASVNERALATGRDTIVDTRVSARGVPRRGAVPPANAGGADLSTKVENLLIERMQNASTPGQRITYYRAFLNMASSDNARRIMKIILKGNAGSSIPKAGKMPAFQPRTKDRFDIVARLIILGDPDAPRLLVDLEKTETSDEAKRYAYAAKAGIATAENKAKYWNDFVNNKDISESWIEAAFGPYNSVRHAALTLPYLEKALAELPNLKRNRKIFFVNGWLGAFIGGQKSEAALAIVNKFLADNPNLDNDLRLKILENVDLIERAVKIRGKR